MSAALLPLPDESSAPFWDGCVRGQLLVQTCTGCGRRRMPPRPMCPACTSLAHSWIPSSGHGRIWSFVVPHPPLLPAFTDLAPYPVVVVELIEDPMIRFVGNLVTWPEGEINEVDPTTIAIGQRVHVVFAAPVEDGNGPPMAIPRWIRD